MKREFAVAIQDALSRANVRERLESFLAINNCGCPELRCRQERITDRLHSIHNKVEPVRPTLINQGDKQLLAKQKAAKSLAEKCEQNYD